MFLDHYSVDHYVQEKQREVEQYRQMPKELLPALFDRISKRKRRGFRITIRITIERGMKEQKPIA
jgi:hypothetical protein